MSNIRLSLIFLLLLNVLVSCKSVPIAQLSQNDGIAKIRNSYRDNQWTDVINLIDEYKTRYPYSEYNQEAELMQADAYFQADRFSEAIAEYEDFVRKNPNNEKVAFAYYRMAQSYDFQDPAASDREQLNAQKAIGKYNYYIKNYSASEWVKDASHRVEILTYRLAKYEAFIANFYWHKDLYAAALSRYLNILQNYSQYDDLKKEALSRGARCYNELADILEAEPQSDKNVYFVGNTSADLRKKAKELSSVVNE